MIVRTIEAYEHTELMSLVDAGMRPDPGFGRSLDDFPVALGLDNREGLYVMERDGEMVAGLTCLVRPLLTSLGEISVACLGSVVTREVLRGQGLSSQLQREVLDRLKARRIPLAVLWSDHPEWYTGRGFRPAGVEYHVRLADWSGPAADRPGGTARRYRPDDAPAVAALYRRHPYRTVRSAGDDARLYRMPGTSGLVWEGTAGEVVAYLFCGKGADFPAHILEWGGELAQLEALLAEIRQRQDARWLMIPLGGEALLGRLADAGARWFAQPAGLWRLLDAGPLIERWPGTGLVGLEAERAGERRATDPVAWLGEVDTAGRPRAGPLRVAVWGFDSV